MACSVTRPQTPSSAFTSPHTLQSQRPFRVSGLGFRFRVYGFRVSKVRFGGERRHAHLFELAAVDEKLAVEAHVCGKPLHKVCRRRNQMARARVQAFAVPKAPAIPPCVPTGVEESAVTGVSGRLGLWGGACVLMRGDTKTPVSIFRWGGRQEITRHLTPSSFSDMIIPLGSCFLLWGCPHTSTG